MIVQCALLKCYTILGYSTETVLLIFPFLQTNIMFTVFVIVPTAAILHKCPFHKFNGELGALHDKICALDWLHKQAQFHHTYYTPEEFQKVNFEVTTCKKSLCCQTY